MIRIDCQGFSRGESAKQSRARGICFTPADEVAAFSGSTVVFIRTKLAIDVLRFTKCFFVDEVRYILRHFGCAPVREPGGRHSIYFLGGGDIHSLLDTLEAQKKGGLANTCHLGSSVRQSLYC